MTTTPENLMTSGANMDPAADPVIHIDGEAVRVLRPGPALHVGRVTARHETQVVRALRFAATSGQIPGSPPEGYGRALARALTIDPAVTVARLRHGIDPVHSTRADTATIVATLSPFTALPGHQPRGASEGGRYGQVPDPTEGHDEAAARLGLTALVFDDPSHLRDWCIDALARSLPAALRRGRREEIASTGVRQRVTAQMTLLQFRDGTAEQWVPMISDGISRLAVCATTLLGAEGSNARDAATAVLSHLVPPGALAPESSPHQLARLMRQKHEAVIKDFTQHVVDGVADERATKLQQFATLPATMHLMATDLIAGAACPLERAIEGVVSDLHTGVAGWGDADNALFRAKSALKQMTLESRLDSDLLALCLGRADLRTTPLLRSPLRADQPSSARTDDDTGMDRLLLRRAVVVLSSLVSPRNYAPLKDALRDISDKQRLRLEHVVDIIAPLVCEPWGSPRPITRAWGYGGPVPSWATNVELDPAHPDDYLALVDVALDESSSAQEVEAARLELALAGGTALIADGLLTTALVGGSGGASASLPFRGAINTAVDALTCSEVGLTALALAANCFRPSKPLRQARPPGVDLTKPDKIARDGVGTAVPITETALANFATLALTQPEAPSAPRHEPTPLESLQARAHTLPDEAQAMMRSAELIEQLYEETGGPTGLDVADLDATYNALTQAARMVGRLR